MNILLVNNSTRHLASLKSQLADHQLEIVDYQPGVNFNTKGKDLVILSGGGGEGREVHDKHKGDLWYRDGLNFILDCPLPMIGICMGFELMAHAYGSDIVRLSKGKRGSELLATRKGQLLRQTELHDFAVQEVSGKSFEVLADSDSGIEIMRHRQRRQVATQFHPELEGSISLKRLVRQFE